MCLLIRIIHGLIICLPTSYISKFNLHYSFSSLAVTHMATTMTTLITVIYNKTLPDFLITFHRPIKMFNTKQSSRKIKLSNSSFPFGRRITTFSSALCCGPQHVSIDLSGIVGVPASIGSYTIVYESCNATNPK